MTSPLLGPPAWPWQRGSVALAKDAGWQEVPGGLEAMRRSVEVGAPLDAAFVAPQAVVALAVTLAVWACAVLCWAARWAGRRCWRWRGGWEGCSHHLRDPVHCGGDSSPHPRELSAGAIEAPRGRALQH